MLGYRRKERTKEGRKEENERWKEGENKGRKEEENERWKEGENKGRKERR